MNTTTTDPRRIDVENAKEKIEQGEAVLVDIRHPGEHAYESIEGARLVPESELTGEKLRELADGKDVVLYCRTSRRTAEAVDKLMSEGYGEVVHLDGGLEAWKQGGCQTVKSPGAPRFSIMQQVQIGAGSMVLAGSLLGLLVHPGFFAIPLFVGAGLTFAGLSGFCGMARMLEAMPWNKRTA